MHCCVTCTQIPAGNIRRSQLRLIKNKEGRYGKDKVYLPRGSSPSLVPAQQHPMKIIRLEQREVFMGSALRGPGLMGSGGHCPVCQRFHEEQWHPADSVGTKYWTLLQPRAQNEKPIPVIFQISKCKFISLISLCRLLSSFLVGCALDQHSDFMVFCVSGLEQSWKSSLSLIIELMLV